MPEKKKKPESIFGVAGNFFGKSRKKNRVAGEFEIDFEID
jgi:hypothetical protein